LEHILVNFFIEKLHTLKDDNKNPSKIYKESRSLKVV